MAILEWIGAVFVIAVIGTTAYLGLQHLWTKWSEILWR